MIQLPWSTRNCCTAAADIDAALCDGTPPQRIDTKQQQPTENKNKNKTTTEEPKTKTHAASNWDKIRCNYTTTNDGV